MSAPEQKLATSKEVADYLGVSLQTMANWASAGKGPAFVKAGGQRRYRWADVHSYAGTPDPGLCGPFVPLPPGYSLVLTFGDNGRHRDLRRPVIGLLDGKAAVLDHTGRPVTAEAFASGAHGWHVAPAGEL